MRIILLTDHPYNVSPCCRLPSWGSPSWQTILLPAILMKDHPHGRPLSWQTTLMQTNLMTDVIFMTDHTHDKAWKNSHLLATIKPDISTGLMSPWPQERIDCPSLEFCFRSKLNSLSQREASYYSHITWATHFRFHFFTTVLSHWDFSHGKFRLLFPGKASCDRVTLPNLLVHIICF